jgi:hypothetical protein
MLYTEFLPGEYSLPSAFCNLLAYFLKSTMKLKLHELDLYFERLLLLG